MKHVWLLDFNADAGAGDYYSKVSAHQIRAGARERLYGTLEGLGYIGDLERLSDAADLVVGAWQVTYAITQLEVSP